MTATDLSLNSFQESIKSALKLELDLLTTLVEVKLLDTVSYTYRSKELTELIEQVDKHFKEYYDLVLQYNSLLSEIDDLQSTPKVGDKVYIITRIHQRQNCETCDKTYTCNAAYTYAVEETTVLSYTIGINMAECHVKGSVESFNMNPTKNINEWGAYKVVYGVYLNVYRTRDEAEKVLKEIEDHD